MININGKNYVKIKDKLAEVDHLDAKGKPVLNTWSEEKIKPDGTKDCTVHIECLQIAGATNK